MDIINLKKSSIEILKHKTSNTHNHLRKVLKNIFKEKSEFYINMSLKRYRELMIEAQNIINANEIGSKIIKEIRPKLNNYIKTNKFLIQSNVYLRASRPITNNETESVGWHRESFYGFNMEKSINCWTPLKGVTKNNTLKFIPESQNLKDSEIIVKKEKSKSTKQFSTGHKLGFLYQPKRITSGVDFSKKKNLIVPYGNTAIFKGNLIHGAAQNNSKNIRFSIDFRIIREKDYKSNSKQFHFSSSKPYFIKYDES